MTTLNRIAGLDFRVAVIPVLALCSYAIFQTLHYPPHDFSNSYFPARFLLDGEFTVDIFDPYLFNRRIFDSGTKEVFASFIPNPPSVAIFFVPFALLPLIPAKIVFDVFSVIVFFISVYRLCRFTKVSPSLVFLFLPVVFLLPLRNNLLFGQSYLIVVSLMIEGFIAHKKQRPWLSAIFWTVAIFLKVFPGVVLIFLIARKKYREAFIVSGCCAVLFLACVVLQGVDVWSYYLREALPRSSAGDISLAYTTGMQSAGMLCKYVFEGDAISNQNPLVDNRYLSVISLALFSALILSAAVRAARTLNNGLLTLGMLLLGAQLISPQGSTYSNLLLIIILIAVTGKNPDRRSVFVCILMILICNLPVSIFQELPLLLRFPRLVLLTTLFIVLCVFNRIVPDKGLVLIFFVISATPGIITASGRRDAPGYFVSDDSHPLIYDYGVENGTFYYMYWDSNGPNKVETTQIVTSMDTIDVSVVNGQVLYKGVDVTHRSGNKIKPSVVNNNRIIFLSDQGRGIGFYTVRSVEIPQN